MTRSAADVLMLQELRRVFDDSSADPLSKSSRGVGWNLQASSAKAGTASLASGGVAVAAKRGTGIVAHRGVVRDGFGHRMHFSFVNAVLRGGIHCWSIYLRDSEGLSPENLALLEEAAAIVSALRGPWVIAGDWNVEPGALLASGWVDLINGVVVAPQLPTCHNHTYDYFVVSKNIAHAVAGIQRIEDAGLFPHWPSRLLIRGDARRHLVRQLVRPEFVPAVLLAGPLPRSRALFPSGIDATAAASDSASGGWHVAAGEEWRSLMGGLRPFITLCFRLGVSGWSPC